jgi:hypothetical protein
MRAAALQIYATVQPAAGRMASREGIPLDRAPDKLPNTASRLIAMAASLVGDAQSVMMEMKCSIYDFHAYCAAQKEPPVEELDRLLKLIIREQGNLIAKNRELIATMRAKREGQS